MSDFLPRPAIAPPAVWSFPTPSRARLSNGIELIIFELPGPACDRRPIWCWTSRCNAEDRALKGSPRSARGALDEGTPRHAGDEFAELLETEGAGFGIDSSLSGTAGHPRCSCSHLDRALELFAEAVTEPALADPDVDRHVQLGSPRSNRPKPTLPRPRASPSALRFSTGDRGPPA